MRVLVLALVFSFALIACAEDTPPAQLTISWSSFELRPGVAFAGANVTSGQNMNGWNTAISKSFTYRFGVTGEADGAYRSFRNPQFPEKTSLSNYTFLAGPSVLLFDSRGFRPFLHVLAGFGHTSASTRTTNQVPPLILAGSDTAFAAALGGGVETRFTQMNRLAIHLGVDWVRTNYFSRTQNNSRVLLGLSIALSQPKQ